MSTASAIRLTTDLKRLTDDAPAGVSGAPHDGNIMIWDAIIFGPPDTLWDGGQYFLKLRFSVFFGGFDGLNMSTVVIVVLREGGRMSTACASRLTTDLKRLTDDAPAGVSGAPREGNIMIWDAIIFGPPDTLWDGGIFKLTLEFRQDYPNTPPKVKFVSNMFHPNVYKDGGICLDILQNKWSPAYDVVAVLTSIQSLLCDPNPDSPANSVAAQLYCQDLKDYKRRVREVVEESLL